MAEKLLRVFNKLDIDDIKEHLLIYGTLAASCSKCNELGLKIETPKCPKCGTEFKYITFRNIKENMAKIQKIHGMKPNMKIIDYDDYKRLTGALKAQGLFND